MRRVQGVDSPPDRESPSAHAMRPGVREVVTVIDPIQHRAAPGQPQTSIVDPAAPSPALDAASLREAAARRDVTSLWTARRHRAALVREIQFFEQAIAAPAGDPGWRQRVAARLGGLRGAFAGHMGVTEGPDGLYAELLDHAPRLARRVHVLIREHVVMAATMAALQRRVDLPETTVEELRGWASDLLRVLSRHRQRGADLVYEAYQMDIGGET